MSYHDQEFQPNNGVRIDHKGRLIVTLPEHSVDDFACTYDDDNPPITELMHRDVDPRQSGSKGRRRRRASGTGKYKEQAPRAESFPRAHRLGRPLIGSEARVYVQTSIAKQTRDLLNAHRVTLADVFEAFARELAYAS